MLTNADCYSERYSKDSKTGSGYKVASPTVGTETSDKGSRCDDHVTGRRSSHGPRKVYVLREVDFNSASEVAADMKVSLGWYFV
jgi:hypothetical protein